MFAYPVVMTRMLRPALAPVIVNGFKADSILFDKFRDHHCQTGPMRDIVKRSLFNMVAVKQYRCAFNDVGYTPHVDVKEFVVRRRARISNQTEIVEDINGSESGLGRSMQGIRARTQPALMAHAVSEGVVSLRHRFEDVPLVVVPQVGADNRLPEAAFNIIGVQL